MRADSGPDSHLASTSCPGREQGCAAMQFNAVVETNRPAVKLWHQLGDRVIGTVPEAFEHSTLGRVGLHIPHRFL